MRLLSRCVAPALCAAAVLVAASCGGTAGTSGAGAVPESSQVVPADAALYAVANTDTSSDQWQKLRAILGRFPDGDKLLAGIRASAASQGVQLDQVLAGVGPELAVAALQLGGDEPLVFARPADPADFVKAVHQFDEDDQDKAVLGTAGDWQIAATSAADLAAAQKAASTGPALAGSKDFQATAGALPADTLARFYVNGADIAREVQKAIKESGVTLPALAAQGMGTFPSLAGSVRALDDGLEFQTVMRGQAGAGKTDLTYKTTLPSVVPAGAIAFGSFDAEGLHFAEALRDPRTESMLKIEQALGIPAAKLAALVPGEGAFYVRQGSPYPEVTLLLDVDDPQEALATVDLLARRLAARFGLEVVPTQVDGVPARRIVGAPVNLYYAIVDGRLVITDSRTGITGLKDDGPRLADDARFKAATEAAGMPGKTIGFLYVDVHSALTLAQSFAALAGQPIPPRVRSNLDPVQSVVAYGTQSGSAVGFTTFVAIK